MGMSRVTYTASKGRDPLAEFSHLLRRYVLVTKKDHAPLGH